MKKQIESNSAVWLGTFVLAGAGCTLLGPFLPSLGATWRLQDHEAGLLIACLFSGSFLGTLLISNQLRRTLRIGSLTAFLGFLSFALLIKSPRGFVLGTFALALAGFGLGQLMSSINLVAGSGPANTRAGMLAKIGAAWCAGAVLSPALTTVLIPGSPTARVGLYAFLFLLPAAYIQRRTLPTPGMELGYSSAVAPRSGIPNVTVFCATVFFIYGGIEASIGGWMPMFAVRYGLDKGSASQWMMSLFWSGLIIGRVLTAKTVRRSVEATIVRVALISSACCIVLLVATSSIRTLIACSIVIGICIGPIFPLLLSAVIECQLAPRAIGVILAASGLGAAILPYLFGILSSASSLQTAMLLPFVSLLVLLYLRWFPPHLESETRYQTG
jgi:FHS family glucose/mannose:H+ symporter-like MFS transporter